MCTYLKFPTKWVNWLTHFCEPVGTVDWRLIAPSRAHDIFGEQRPQSVIVGHILWKQSYVSETGVLYER
jgi:hypothetical protein